MSKDNNRHETDAIRSEVEGIEQAFKEAVREALLEHKRAGNPVASWENGRVVWIPPEEIPVDEDSTGSADGEAS